MFPFLINQEQEGWDILLQLTIRPKKEESLMRGETVQSAQFRKVTERLA